MRIYLPIYTLFFIHSVYSLHLRSKYTLKQKCEADFNFIQNPGFETPVVNKWTVFDNYSEEFQWGVLAAVKLGKGNDLIPDWDSQVVSLDPNLPSEIYQKFSIDSNIYYLNDCAISFEYASASVNSGILVS
jgi:hypothetical protein